MNPTDDTPVTTVLLKIEDIHPKALDAVYDALDIHVVEQGGSYFTLVEDGKRLRVDEGSPHLVVERLEASLYAHARSLHALCIENGLPVPRQLARDYADFCAFFDNEEGIDEDDLDEANEDDEDDESEADEDDLDEANEDDESEADEDDESEADEEEGDESEDEESEDEEDDAEDAPEA